jgi:hypothetical protein
MACERSVVERPARALVMVIAHFSRSTVVHTAGAIRDTRANRRDRSCRSGVRTRRPPRTRRGVAARYGAVAAPMGPHELRMSAGNACRSRRRELLHGGPIRGSADGPRFRVDRTGPCSLHAVEHLHDCGHRTGRRSPGTRKTVRPAWLTMRSVTSDAVNLLVRHLPRRRYGSRSCRDLSVPRLTRRSIAVAATGLPDGRGLKSVVLTESGLPAPFTPTPQPRRSTALDNGDAHA